MSKIIVENTTARLLVIPPAGAVIGTPQTDRVALSPGFNKVDENVIARALGIEDEKTKNNAVATWFDQGMLRLVEGKTDLPIPETLEGVNAKDSIAFVDRVKSTETLHRWRDDEERATVLKALDARLAALGETDDD